MARHASRFVHIEAESDDEYESGEYSEDIDNLVSVAPRTKSYGDFTREMEEKYIGEEYSDEESAEAVEVPAQSRLLPMIRSPLLFLVRCKPGREREVSERIHEAIVSDGGSPGVYSVITKDGLSGYVYLEAHKKQEVEDVLARVRGVGRNRLSVVPFGEMVEALTYKTGEVLGEYARVRGGKYKGDVVRIEEVYDDVVKIRAVPRLEGDRKLFRPEEYRDAVKKDDGWIYKRDFYKNGFLEKVVLKPSLEYEIEPTFDEIKQLGMATPVGVNDRVRVKCGDLQSAIGSVVSTGGNGVVVAAEVDGKKRMFEVNAGDVEKAYVPGDEVSHRGVNGVVVGMDGDKIVILVNNFTEERKVSAEELGKPSEAGRMEEANPRAIRMRRDPLVNKRVCVNEGEFKGYAGVIKEVYKGKCRVQLNSTLNFITLDRNALTLSGSRTDGYKGDNSQTDGSKVDGYKADSSRTPFYKTPAYKTPNYQTPSYKTPAYRTPAYRTPAYKTPNYHTPAYQPDLLKEHEDADVDWLAPKSPYEGTLISDSNSQIITVSHIEDGAFIDTTGKTYSRNSVKYVVPQKYDNVIILDGAHSGVEGALITVNDAMGTVKASTGESYQVKMSDMSKKIVNKY